MMRGVIAVSMLMMPLAALPLSAQQLPAGLTLEDALRIAREHSPVYQRTTNDLELASDAVRSAWAAFMPTLSTSLSSGLSMSRRTIAENEFGEVGERPTTVTTRSSSSGQSISAGMQVFNATLLPNVRAEQAQYEVASAQIEGAAIQLDAQVSRAFYAAVQATRNITLEEQLLASARERLEHTEQLMGLAARTRVDLLGAQEEVLTSEQNLQRARGTADKARLTLAVTMGIEPQLAMTVDTVMPPVFDPAELNVEQLVADAVVNSPDVLQRMAALRAAGHRRSAASAQRWPTVSMSGSYGRSGSARGYGGFGELDLPNSGTGMSMSISLPLFSRFQTSRAIGAAAAAEQDASHDLRSAQLTVESEVRSRVIDLASAYRAL
ncbi:hypothetical protein BH23GEM10_BH23GEM10_06700 [soil metagenome]